MNKTDCVCLAAVCSSRCSVLECWFVQERPGGGFSVGMSQEKSALYIRTDSDSEKIEQKPPSDISPSRVYYVSGQCDVYQSHIYSAICTGHTEH